jgi:hypothetical protein
VDDSTGGGLDEGREQPDGGNRGREWPLRHPHRLAPSAKRDGDTLFGLTIDPGTGRTLSVQLERMP